MVKIAAKTVVKARIAKQLKDADFAGTFLAGDGVYGAQFPDAAGDGELAAEAPKKRTTRRKATTATTASTATTSPNPPRPCT